MTDTDRLAALLHEAAMAAYGQRKWAQAPWPTDMYDWLADWLRAAGVTLLDEERLARALHGENYVGWTDHAYREMAGRIARAYREDSDD